MATNYSHKSSYWMLSIKVILVSTTVLSMAVMLKLSVPAIMEFTLSEVPSVWSVFTSWLRPPYLYLVINCIIIIIVASSRLQSKVDDPLLPPEAAVLLQPMPVKVLADDVRANEVVELGPEFEKGYSTDFGKVSLLDSYEHVNGTVSEADMLALEKIVSGNESTSSKSLRPPMRNDAIDFSFPAAEKPPASARFGHRKSVKSTFEGGRALGVSKPKRQDTLESTWKTITEGRSMPLTRHLRKSDTWETHGRSHHLAPEMDHQQDERMTKSETFDVGDRRGVGGRSHNYNTSAAAATATATAIATTMTLSRSTSGKLKKEASLGQEELNRKVEAFIKKFNEDMRLQRQESLNQYMEMINRGTH